MSEWIPVWKKRPQDGEWVLVTRIDGTMAIARRYTAGIYSGWENTDRIVTRDGMEPLGSEKRVVSWMPLPDTRGEAVGGADGVMNDIERLIVETEDDDPKIIAYITADEVILADGYRVRCRPFRKEK
jgi:hypothetical protein